MSDHLSEAELATAGARLQALRAALNAVLFGQETLVDNVITALVQGHLLIEGLPGLGKTELVKGLAKALRLDAKRVQFTPDLLPGDITAIPFSRTTTANGNSCFSPGHCSPTSSWRTRSTAPRPRRSPPCSKPCRSGA